ncbi:hypothetical protein HDV05_001218, partial [Chytridiales sp. JEL 0842]
MADPNAAAAAPGAIPGQPGQQQPQSTIGSMISSIFRIFIIFSAIQYFTGSNKQSTPTGPQIATTDTNINNADLPHIQRPPHYIPIWTQRIQTDLFVYLSEQEEFVDFGDERKLVWRENGLEFGDLKEVRYKEVEVAVPETVQKNGTWYAHVYLTSRGRSPNPLAKSYIKDGTLYTRKMLTRYMPKKKVVAKKKLIKGKEVEEEGRDGEDEEGLDEEKKETPIVSYWWPNVTVSIVPEIANIPSNSPPNVLSHLNLAEDGLHYYPIFYVDDFWLLSENLQLINETTPKLNMTLQYQPKSFWYFNLMLQFDQNFKMQTKMMGSDEREVEQIKSMFLDTNPVLLAVTIAVSILHSIFDFLAFKNDIQFWQNKKDLDGLSFRTILMNVSTQLIIFLYLFDNDTSWMIIISN